MAGRRVLGGPVAPRPFLEQVRIPLYDSVTIDSGDRENQFFALPVGSTDTGAMNGASKTLGDTNIETANSLATPKTFDIEAISVKYPTDISIADLREFLREGWVEIFVGSKTYLQVPLAAIPGDVGLHGPGDHHTQDGDAQAVVDYLHNGAGVHGNRFDLRIQEEVVDAGSNASVLTGSLVPIHLPSNQFFRVTFTFPGTLTLAASRRVYVYLWGVLKREVH